MAFKTSQKELKKIASQFIDFKELFPKSTVNSRTKMNDYQSRKIKSAIRDIAKNATQIPHEKISRIKIADIGTILDRDFVPLKGAKKYMKDKGLQTYNKGIFLTGGSRDNKNAVYSKGAIRYERGDSERTFYQLNNWSERTLRTSFREAIDTLPSEGIKRLTANGRAVRNMSTRTNPEAADDELLEELAVQVYNKYKSMALAGEYRNIPNAKGGFSKVLAAHPKKWGLGILHESNPPTEYRSAAEKAWDMLTPSEKRGWKAGAEYLGTTKKQAFIKVYNTK
jgi:hypothetical protein